MPDGREVLSDLLRSAFSPHGRMFETLRTLVFKPGEVTRAYLAGQRMRYTHPVRVYLLCMFIFLGAISINHSWRSWGGQKPFEAASAEVFSRASTSPDSIPADAAPTKRSAGASYEAGKSVGEAVGRAAKEALPPWLLEKIKARAQRNTNVSEQELIDRAFRAMTQNYSVLFALLVPIMAALNWLLFAGRGISYGGHFIFILHTTAGGAMILTPAYLFNVPTLYFPLVLVSMIWAVLCARRAFGVSLWGASWRYVLFTIPAMLLSGVLGIAMAALITIFG